MRKIAPLVALSLLISILMPTFAFADAPKVTRISGANRIETAIAAGKATFSAADTAVIANGTNYPDALVGGTLAVQVKGPLLLVEKNEVPEAVKEELKRLKVKTVYLLGGTASVTEEVEKELAKISTVLRIAGTDRYRTADRIGEVRQKLEQAQAASYTYVSGTGFADALTAAPFVAQTKGAGGAMNLLTLALPSDAVNRSVVIGGKAAVAGNSPNRIAGANRYATAVAVANQYPSKTGKTIDTVVLVSGENFPDALSAAALVANKNAVLLLTQKDRLPGETADYIKNHAIKEIVIIGGESSVSKSVADRLGDLRTSKQNGKTVFIDPGHQAKANTDTEPVGPGATEKKAKVSAGTKGVSTGRAEYDLNLEVSLKLGAELEKRGYTVYYSRTTNDVDISNVERAKMAAEKKADIFLRMHANGAGSAAKEGVLMVIGMENSKYNAENYKKNRKLAELLLHNMLKTTGAANDGIWETDTMSGNNWSTVPVVLVEMGYMTNPTEDKNLSNATYQQKLIDGLVQGIEAYFKE